MKVKKIIIIALIVCLLGIGALGVKIYNDAHKTKEPEMKPVTKICDYVVDVGTYTSIDYDYSENYFKKKYDTWSAMCTAVAKVVDNGDMVVGRNMDLYISNKPVYVSRSKVEGCYETINLTYSNRSGPDYYDSLENGIPEDFYKVIPFLATDVLNSEGLYIETNMRNDEYWTNGNSKFGCSGTNPESDIRVCALNLPQYLGGHCATVDEAVAVAKKLDIYTINTRGIAWNLCFIMADATGHYGLMEIANNKVSWLDGQPAQTNFYVTEEFAEIQELKSGTGRYAVVMDGVGNVRNEKDMYDLMDKVLYFQAYTPKIAQYDVRSEFVAAHDNWTYDYVMDEKNRDEIMELLDAYGDYANSMTRQELQDKNAFWETTFNEIVNCTNKTIFVRFFEDDTRTVLLKF